MGREEGSGWVKRNETMPFEAMWMDLEIIIVSEVS